MFSMSHTITVEAFELRFQAGSSDKFYRVFTWSDGGEGHALVQYGRTGTSGQLKATTYPDLDAANAFAQKQANAKKAKGYVSHAAARFTTTSVALDGLALDGLLIANIAGSTAALEAAASDTDRKRDEAAARAASLTADVAAPESTQADIEDALATTGIVATRLVDTTSSPVPQLAETADSLEDLLADSRWVAQEKVDGDRLLVVVTDGQVVALNRSGQPKTTNLTADMLAPFKAFTSGRWVFDGEIVNRTLHLFDLAEANGYVTTDTPFFERHEALTVIVTMLASDHVQLVPVHGPASRDKNLLLDNVTDTQGEGLIFRERNARYSYGHRGNGLRKHKFINEADCYVTDVATEKASVTLAVQGPGGREVIVGRASTIGKATVAVGDVVEVRFQYVLDPANPTMIQPRILRRRTDKTATECHLAQFATAGTRR